MGKDIVQNTQRDYQEQPAQDNTLLPQLWGKDHVSKILQLAKLSEQWHLAEQSQLQAVYTTGVTGARTVDSELNKVSPLCIHRLAIYAIKSAALRSPILPLSHISSTAISLPLTYLVLIPRTVLA